MSTSLVYHGFGIVVYRYVQAEYMEGAVIFTISRYKFGLRCPVCKSKRIIKTKYSFCRWFSATAGYTYSRQDSDNVQLIDYNEHRVYLTLGAEKELLRW